MSFAFALVAMGTALAVSLRGYLTAAGRTEQRVIDRISMESVAAAYLGKIAAGEAVALGPSVQPEMVLNARGVILEASLPEGKRDPSGDTFAEVADAFAQAGLPTPSQPIKSPSLTELSKSQKLGSSQEDCLRRVMTFGRYPAAYEPTARWGSTEWRTQNLTAGDQIDLRLSVEGRQNRSIVWMRARVVGGDAAWAVHDYRLLSSTTELRHKRRGVWVCNTQ